MSHIRFSALVALVALVAVAPSGHAQSTLAAAAASGPHTIVVQLVDRPGSIPYGFEPSTFSAQHGDTIRFVQAASAMHNVHFKSAPKGARLGSAAVSNYLTTKGQSTSIVIDGRFSPGKYEIVCDPHEMIGMHAFLTVQDRSAADAGDKERIVVLDP